MIRYFISIFIALLIWQTTNGQKVSMQKEFPQSIADGSLKMNKSYFFYKTVNHNEIKEDSILIYNDSKAAIELNFDKAPAHICLTQSPKSLLPGEKGIIRIAFNASKNIDKKGNIRWGKGYKRIPISIKGKENLRNSRTDFITIRSFVQEDFSHLSKRDLKRAPQAVFDTLEYNFGEVPQGTVIIHDFIVRNEGKDDLDIRYAKGC